MTLVYSEQFCVMALDYLVFFGGPDRRSYRIFTCETCNKKVTIICIYSYIYCMCLIIRTNFSGNMFVCCITFEGNGTLVSKI